MENYFNKYYDNKVDDYNGYTDTTWYYQDPMYVQTQNMNEYILQEMPPAVERRGNNNQGNRGNDYNQGNRGNNRNPSDNRPGNRPGGRDDWRNPNQGNWDGPGGNRDRWNDRDDNRGGWEDMRGGPPMGSMPLAPPPSRIPARRASVLRVDAASIRNCMRRPTYIWQSNGMEYWMLPVNISPTTLSGFRWDGRRGWTFGGVSLNRIDSFTCI